jgi:hypothetical protein
MPGRAWYEVAPSAARLTGSLRDIGYDFPTAVADVVDNSVAAGASTVDVQIEYEGTDSRVFISDDGHGMSAPALIEALRFGTRRSYERGELGRYGLGLKTASLSQCRSLTVVTRNSRTAHRVLARTLDLDVVEEWDQWVVIEPARSDPDVQRARAWLAGRTGTVVLWRVLDRVLPEKKPDGGWARRRMDSLATKTAEHLGIVFHRFLEGSCGSRRLSIKVNGQRVDPWNPFAPDEAARTELPMNRFQIEAGDLYGDVTLRRFILPARDRFSTPGGFERLSGPLNWNRQQGLYVYRANRLVQWGGWSGIRGIDEHTKLARASLDFDTDLDAVFNINVAKMKVALPAQLRQLIEGPVNELCLLADDAYRKTSRAQLRAVLPEQRQPAETRSGALTGQAPSSSPAAGLALRVAAMQADQWAAWERIEAVLRAESPEVAQELGLDVG